MWQLLRVFNNPLPYWPDARKQRHLRELRTAAGDDPIVQLRWSKYETL